MEGGITFSVDIGAIACGKNYTRNEWRRCKTTLETSGEDVKLHSKLVWSSGGNVQASLDLSSEAIRITNLIERIMRGMETYSRIGLPQNQGDLQSYWTTEKLRKLTVVLYY